MMTSNYGLTQITWQPNNPFMYKHNDEHRDSEAVPSKMVQSWLAVDSQIKVKKIKINEPTHILEGSSLA